MLTEDILDKIGTGPEHSPALHGRPDFNVSNSKFAVFQNCIFTIWMRTFYGGARNLSVTESFLAPTEIWLGFVCDLLACRLVHCTEHTWKELMQVLYGCPAGLAKRYVVGFQITSLYLPILIYGPSMKLTY